MKSVNMKSYTFGNDKVRKSFKGYGMYDEKKNAFLSVDGRNPYVVSQKRTADKVLSQGNFNAYARVIGNKVK